MKRHTACFAVIFLGLCLICLVTLNTSATSPKPRTKALSPTVNDRLDPESRTERRDEVAAGSRARPEVNELAASPNRRGNEKHGLMNRISGFFKGLFVREQESQEGDDEDNDPDSLPFLRGKMNSAEYLAKRQEWVNMKLGMTPGITYDPTIRVRAIEAMECKQYHLRA